MAWYEVEWTEKVTRKARVQIPNDEQAQENGGLNAVAWAKEDLETGAATLLHESPLPLLQVRSVSRVDGSGRVTPL